MLDEFLALWLAALIVTAVWALVALALLPELFGGSLALMTLQAPDVGHTVVASGAVALAWAVIRTILVAATLSVAAEPPTSSSALPVPATAGGAPSRRWAR